MEGLSPNLLMIVQKLDSSDFLLGFILEWVKELNKHVNNLYVLTLYKGKFDLGEKIKVFSLGKEKKKSRIFYIFNLYRIVIPLVKTRKIDGIFVFQGGWYPVLLLPIKIVFRFKLVQWKVHSIVNFQTKLNLIAADKILTAASTCFQKRYKKIKLINHGINTELFKLNRGIPRKDIIVVVGRISTIKRLKEIIFLYSRLITDSRFSHFKLDFYGSPRTKKDEKYLKDLGSIVEGLGLNDCIHFQGAVDHHRMPIIYSQAKISLNLGNIGSLDKTIIESMACETPVVMRTPAIKEQLGEYKDLLHAPDDDTILADVKRILQLTIPEYKRMGSALRNVVKRTHELPSLMKKISHEFKTD